MGEYDLCVTLNYWWGDTNKDTQTDTHINTMTWPSLRAWPSEKLKTRKHESKATVFQVGQ